MYKDKKILGIIPARGGSKGILHKNIRELHGKPLIAWTLEEAYNSKYLDRCVISTDDMEIVRVGKQYGGDVPFMRSEELSSDEASSVDVVIDVAEKIPGYDYIVLLQATVPLRKGSDIDNAIELCIDNERETCVSVTEVTSSPYWMYYVDDKFIKPILKIDQNNVFQRQRLPKVYQLNGAIYVNTLSFLKKNHAFIDDNTISYIMPNNRSYDIDTEDDLNYLEYLLNRIGE